MKSTKEQRVLKKNNPTPTKVVPMKKTKPVLCKKQTAGRKKATAQQRTEKIIQNRLSKAVMALMA